MTVRQLAGLLGILSVVAFGGGVGLELAASVSVGDRVVTFAIIVVFSAVGTLIVSRQPRNPIGWIFCGAALVGGLATLADGYAWYWLEGKGGSEPLGDQVVEAMQPAYVSLWLREGGR